jgi:hypothetical protein
MKVVPSRTVRETNSCMELLGSVASPVQRRLISAFTTTME